MLALVLAHTSWGPARYFPAVVRLGWAELPPGVSWRHLWGAGILGGIGFTMSLFITLLAQGEHTGGEAVAKLAILLASGVSGAVGYLLLRRAPALAANHESGPELRT